MRPNFEVGTLKLADLNGVQLPDVRIAAANVVRLACRYKPVIGAWARDMR